MNPAYIFKFKVSLNFIVLVGLSQTELDPGGSSNGGHRAYPQTILHEGQLQKEKTPHPQPPPTYFFDDILSISCLFQKNNVKYTMFIFLFCVP